MSIAWQAFVALFCVVSIALGVVFIGLGEVFNGVVCILSALGAAWTTWGLD